MHTENATSPRAMRRKDRQLTAEQTRAVLERSEFGALATVNDDGSPYCTYLSYVLLGQKIYFHCAHQGHKIDNLARDSRVCFSVVNNVRAAFIKDFTTGYESAVVFGQATPVTNEMEKYDALYALAEKYLPEYMDHTEQSIKKSFDRTAVYAITIEQMTGKAKVLDD